jgi:hypothetical protein
MLARRQDIDEFVELVVQEIPAALDVVYQPMSHVLGRHADAPHTGIDAVAEREIDDAQRAGERHRRLGAPVSQLHKSTAATAGEDHGIGPPRQRRTLLRSLDRVKRTGAQPRTILAFVLDHERDTPCPPATERGVSSVLPDEAPALRPRPPVPMQR